MADLRARDKALPGVLQQGRRGAPDQGKPPALGSPDLVSFVFHEMCSTGAHRLLGERALDISAVITGNVIVTVIVYITVFVTVTITVTITVTVTAAVAVTAFVTVAVCVTAVPLSLPLPFTPKLPSTFPLRLSLIHI